jgi:large subunit ribosomal protein L4
MQKDFFFAEIDKHLLHLVLHWQNERRREGCHSTKGVSEIQGSTRKIQNQKGSGRARHGHGHAPQMRGGAVAMGPKYHPNQHTPSLNKKIRTKGLLMSFSSHLKNNSFFIIKDTDLIEGKSKLISNFLSKFEPGKALFIGSDKESQKNTLQAVKNLYGVNFLPVAGLNVRDIMKTDFLFVFESAMEGLIKRCTIHKKKENIKTEMKK